MGREIDKFDIVVRFNNYPISGYEEHIGKKTDIWCLSDATIAKISLLLEREGI